MGTLAGNPALEAGTVRNWETLTYAEQQTQIAANREAESACDRKNAEMLTKWRTAGKDTL